VGLIIIQDTKYPDLKPDGINRVINNLTEFLHSLTFGGMKSLGITEPLHYQDTTNLDARDDVCITN